MEYARAAPDLPVRMLRRMRGEEERAQVRATLRAVNDDEAFPKYSMTLEGGPFTTPCTMKTDGLPREAVFTSDGCAVRTKNFEGNVELTGAVKLDPADELVATCGSSSTRIHFGKRRSTKAVR